jgi:multidrug efflux system membrane fusion protein
MKHEINTRFRSDRRSIGRMSNPVRPARLFHRKSKEAALKTKSYWIFSLLILSAIFLFVGCKGKQQATGFERPPAPVTVDAAISKDVPVYIDAVGTSVAREVVAIHPQVSGRIDQIHFVDGANVQKGMLLFTIDPRPFQASVHVAEANLSESEAALDLANIEFERMQGLINSKAISQQDYDRRKNTVQIAEARIKQRKAELETARINLSYCFIKSPIDGRAGQRLVDLGNIVTADSPQALLTIQRLDPIYADFTVTENDLSAVQKNMQHGSLTVEVRLPDQTDISRNGSLTFLDNSVLDGTGTVKLRATIANQDHIFWPGRFVNIRLVLNTHKNAVLVPAVAPQNSAKGTFVYIVKPDSTAELRPVTLGQKQGDLIVVNSGVQAGEKVVVNGQLGVTPGGKVKVQENPTAIADQVKNGGKES